MSINVTTSTVDVLKTELETFENNREKLLENEGQYALIYGTKVIGMYKDESDAVTEGYKQFGNVPFLVKLVAQVESPLNFVNNNLGI